MGYNYIVVVERYFQLKIGYWNSSKEKLYSRYTSCYGKSFIIHFYSHEKCIEIESLFKRHFSDMNTSSEMFAVEYLYLYKQFFEGFKNKMEVASTAVGQGTYYNIAKHTRGCKSNVFFEKWKHYIDAIGLHGGSSLQQALTDTFEYDIFNLYSTDTMSKSIFESMILDIPSSNDYVCDNAVTKMLSSLMVAVPKPKPTIKTDATQLHIASICAILRLTSPYDMITEFTDVHLDGFKDYFKTHEDNLKIVFDINIRAKGAFKLQQSATTLSSIFASSWRTVKVLNSAHKQLQEQGKSIGHINNKYYVCKLTTTTHTSKIGVCIIDFHKRWFACIS